MDAGLKKILKSVTLELRHLLEGWYDSAGTWYPGDLESRLASIGVRGDRELRPIDELHLNPEDQHARKVVDAYSKLREEAGVARPIAVSEFLRETAYTWANRLIALRCMESRELIDPVILQQEAYGGRSLEHHRLAQRQPELCTGEDDGLFAVLDKVFREQAQRLPMLFDAHASGLALRPSPAAIKDCFGLLSLHVESLRKYRIRIKEDEIASADAEAPNPFIAPDALGWTYQFWNTEEKERVFETVRTVKGAKIAGADIVPATQLYTEDYMVKFLVQNSLGATWLGMHPQSRLAEGWEYYVRDADRVPPARKPLREVTFLDPACGSGHFLLEAFDLFYAMYEEEGELTTPKEICTAILSQNLFGIDIDGRAVQIAEAALWMKAAERVFDFPGAATNLIAATASHLKGRAWDEFLSGFEREPSVARVLRQFAQTMTNIDEIGSLARPAEDLQEIVAEEHATWERQIREMKEGNFLFPEMRDEALAEQLPFQEISDEQFGHRLFNRAQFALDDFTRSARERGEFDDQMLATETRAGFRLVDVLGRRYDVVAANPPYMGSKNMGPNLKTYLGTRLKLGKRDLYSAFIARAASLCGVSGRMAFVTLDGWCFKKQFAPLRTEVMQNSCLEEVVFLGRHAFSDADPPGLPVMTINCNTPPTEPSRVWSARFVAPREANEQATLLATCVRSPNENSHRIRQYSLLQIPGAGFFTWLPQEVLDRLASDISLGELAECLAGLQTGDAPRFVRFHWECGNNRRWLKFASGGAISRWAGLEWSMVDWRSHGTVIQDFPKSCWRGTHRFESLGFTYSESARGKLAFREMCNGGFSQSGSAFFPRDRADGYALMGILSGRYASYCARFLRPGRAFPVGYLALIPIPKCYESLRDSVMAAVEAKKWLASRDLTEMRFDIGCVEDNGGISHPSNMLDYLAVASALHSLEGWIEEQTFSLLKLSESSVRAIATELGRPAGWLPVLQGSEFTPHLPELLAGLEHLSRPPQETLERISDSPKIRITLMEKLRRYFEAGPTSPTTDQLDTDSLEATDQSENEHDDDTDNGDDADDSGNCMPIPPETFLEELSLRIGLHPVSTYMLLKAGIETQGWRCRAEEQQLCADMVTVIVLRILGHRWPLQLAANEPIPAWADLDGIVSLIPIGGKPTIADEIRQRLPNDMFRDSAFAEVMDTTLDCWLCTDFFLHHTKRFKKRPIAWQIQSGHFTSRQSPAFACLVYYHTLDVDLLRKVRKLAEDICSSQETELRGIASVAIETRSTRQEDRRVELEAAIAELRHFGAKVAAVEATGFGPNSSLPMLRQFAINDAMLSLKGCWLRRVSGLVAKTAMADWRLAANKSGLHADFGTWISDAMAHLNHQCAQVEPQPPDQKSLANDPTSVELAALISPRAEAMLARSLSLACDAWWHPLDHAVFAPLKEQSKALKAEQKQCEDALKAEPEPPAATARALKARVKEIKTELKDIDKDLKAKMARAKQVREQIEQWHSTEPPKWGDWLAEQPLFDQISSIDHRRSPPTTIAEFVIQESLYAPNINDGVRVNIAPLQKAGLLAADVLAAKDVDKAIADRAEWRADERRWVREGKLPQPGWWPQSEENS